jgi:hypothetical protein
MFCAPCSVLYAPYFRASVYVPYRSLTAYHKPGKSHLYMIQPLQGSSYVSLPEFRPFFLAGACSVEWPRALFRPVIGPGPPERTVCGMTPRYRRVIIGLVA